MKRNIAVLLALFLCISLCACGLRSDSAAPKWEKAYYLDEFRNPTDEFYIGTSTHIKGSYSSITFTDAELKAEMHIDTENICIYLFENGTDLVKNGTYHSILFPFSFSTASGTKGSGYGFMVSGGDCIMIPESQKENFLSSDKRDSTGYTLTQALLEENGEVAVYITREDQPATSYLFAVKSRNFAQLYEKEMIPAIQNAIYSDAEALLANKHFPGAMNLFESLGSYQDSEQRFREADNSWRQCLDRGLTTAKRSWLISAGYDYFILPTSAGKVCTKGYSYNCDVSEWENIEAVDAGYNFIVGLQSDHTVVLTGEFDYFEQCNVFEWTGIVAVAAGHSHAVGLRADGTVVAAGDNTYGQCDVSEWSSIVAVAAGDKHIVGLKADGTVVAAGNNSTRQCFVSEWSDIVSVAAGEFHTVGLRADGTVVAVGNGFSKHCTDWTEIIAVSAGYSFTIGLRADGTVVTDGISESNQSKLAEWSNIVAIAAGGYHIVGLQADGTIVFV